MADRYWVGGTAAWDATAGTKWALTSGGAGGQAVPTSSDDVYFDAASGVVTVTISSGNTGAKSINCTGFTGTLTGSGAIAVSGSVTLVTGMTVTYTGTLTLNGTGTLTSAGKILGPVAINGAGITVTLGDALNIGASTFSVSQGTFTTSASNYSLTVGIFSGSGTSARSILLNGSTVNASNDFSFATNTNLTFNAGTSTINLSKTTGTSLQGGATSNIGVTFYNVNFTSVSAGITHQIGGINTFNNLTVTAPSSAGVTQIMFDSRQTINGTLSTTGTAGNRRVWFRSSRYGIAQTLTINSTPNLTDADFRDLYVIGTAAPVSGTRVGDLRGCSNITFDAPKTVYWNLGGTSATLVADAWAATSGGAVSTNNFPLAQDTAVFDNSSTVPTGNIITSGLIPYIGTIDMSSRTTAIRFQTAATSFDIYGNWISGSGTTISDTGILTFSGRNTQTITSAGKSFSGGLTVDTYGGSVELADALNIGSNTLTVTNGTFDTKNYAVTAGSLSSSNSNVRAIKFGSSTLNFSNTTAINFSTAINLVFEAGTSTIQHNHAGAAVFSGGGQTFYNLIFTSANQNTHTINGTNIFNNVTVTAPSAGLMQLSLSANQTINGTLTVAGATPTRRIFVRSSTLGTPRTLTVGTLSATDCDFRDIIVTGTAVGSTPTRAGDCGGNSGIVFSTAKTVYWNLAGTQNWSATAWADTSGGTPAVNNFPLAQDVAVFDDAGAAGTVTINAAWNIGTFDASARTIAMTVSTSFNNVRVHGNWVFGPAVTTALSSGALTFSGRSTSTITSNGANFRFRVTIDCVGGIVQLADAFAITYPTRPLTILTGTFDAITYNVTVDRVVVGSGNKIIKMGSGTWNLTGTGTNAVWDFTNPASLTFYKGTANIVLSDTSTSARTFAGGGLSYNKLTIGGSTGTSALTITGNNQFTELASTKTVAHTIALGTTAQTFGKWTVSGTAGNVVTVSGSGTSHVIAGARVTDVDYLAMGTIGFSTSSPGEFYAGPNSTGSNATILKTAAPTGTTRYWVGGTGTWTAASTTNWSDVSGGAGGASVPTSADAVVFDAASNAAAYTVTCTGTGLRCGSLTFAAPASGAVTWAGTGALTVHDNFTLPATGLTRTYTGAITLSGSTAGRTFTTNGVQLNSNVTINGVGCEWNLGSAFIMTTGSNQITVTNGTFDTKDFNLSTYSFISSNTNTRVIKLGVSTLTLIAGGTSPVDFRNPLNLSFDCGTSTITFSTTQNTFNGGGLTFYNVTNASTNNQNFIIKGINTFNNLTITGKLGSGISPVIITDNQTINGTLTLSAGTNATMRHFVRSDVLGTPRTLTCNSVVVTDADFRDIVIAGAAAPVSGTRLGDCKGNSGITFDAPKTVYWNLAGNNNWSATAWAATAGATPAASNFPLAQDTAVFTATSPASAATTTINTDYNIGTIDMSERTTNTMTLATGSTTPAIYGNWISGTGTTLTGSGAITFAGRGTQTITSAGKTFTQPLIVNTFGGSVTLQDAFSSNLSCTVIQGIFNANGYNVTLTNFNSGYATQRTVAIGSGTWTITASPWSVNPPTNLTVTGTGTVSLTSASAKTFAGGGIDYSGITLNQGGAGTLTITGNNTFGDITSTYSATTNNATTIALGTTTQRVGKFSASGSVVDNPLTVRGTSASSPATLIYTGSGKATTPTTDYLTITGVRAYPLVDTWYAGANSTNNGSLGWNFSSLIAVLSNIYYGTVAPTQIYYGSTPVVALYYGSQKVWE